MAWLEQLAEIGALVGLVLYYAVMVSYVGDARTIVVEARRSEGPLGTLPDR